MLKHLQYWLQYSWDWLTNTSRAEPQFQQGSLFFRFQRVCYYGRALPLDGQRRHDYVWLWQMAVIEQRRYDGDLAYLPEVYCNYSNRWETYYAVRLFNDAGLQTCLDYLRVLALDNRRSPDEKALLLAMKKFVRLLPLASTADPEGCQRVLAQEQRITRQYEESRSATAD